ncbi:hypothetical protein [Staphylococcus xylosus]|uniref:hypothetical protein n=1 Tax=Staphylococcus xylosus TaxID=1288 RepID=UPI0015F7C254|nr:hypothetical protein [Staphylococcus xylosus]
MYVLVCDVVAATAANVVILFVANDLSFVGAELVDSDVDVDKVILFDPKSSDVLS